MSKGKPATGYNFGNKRQYRRTFWRFVDDCLFDVPASKRRALILDTSDGEETKFLVQTKGYRASNLYVVNQNRAELAWLTRRLAAAGIAGVNVFGREAFDLLWEFSYEKNFQFDVVNLDLTGPVSQELITNLSQIDLHDRLIVAVTVLRGREHLTEREYDFGTLIHPELEDAKSGSDGAPTSVFDPLFRAFGISQISGHDLFRLRSLFIGLCVRDGAEAFPRAMRWGSYRSTAGSQSMMWLAHYFRSTRITENEARKLPGYVHHFCANAFVISKSLNKGTI